MFYIILVAIVALFCLATGDSLLGSTFAGGLAAGSVYAMKNYTNYRP